MIGGKRDKSYKRGEKAKMEVIGEMLIYERATVREESKQPSP